ncbi:hypothetical protein Aperf_G00000006787 [Anoplocephala perfoliata]
MPIKAFSQDGGIRYRRWNGIATEADSNTEYVDIQPTQHLSIYADAVIGEEVLDQKYESLEYDTPEVPALKTEMATAALKPVAGGSGIPQIKCYLNGLNIPFVLRGKTMLIKAIGVVLAVCGGLIVGKEGPMIHIGAVIAAGFSQGRLTWCNFSSKLFNSFRNDPEKRDFVNAGAAAGVAAAFGAPVGGMLFTLEEGASFIFQRLTWNTLFSSVMSMFTLALFRSLFDGQPFSFTPGGLVSFGMFEGANSYNATELVIFVLMGVFGGLVGAAFVALNKVISKYRQAHLKTKPAKIIDAVLISILTAASSFALLIFMSNCRSGFQENSDSSRQVLCADGEYNRFSSLLFATPSKALQALFHHPPHSFNKITLLIFIPYIFFVACITYGVSVPSGLFIPSLLLGAAWGRLVGDLLHAASPTIFPDPSKFALIGAAAQLGGIVRMIASLTVVLMEATGAVILGLPVLITLIPAKYIGDYFTEGIYDTHINLAGMALVPWEISPMCVQLRALDVMTTPAVVLDPIMSIGDLYHLVFDHPHHAFPIVEGPRDPDNFNYGQLIGVMPASYIALMIKKKIYLPLKESENVAQLTAKDFDDAYPRFFKLTDVLLSVTDDEFERMLDFRPYMNPSPYSVLEGMSMTRVFALFRRLGLRHLPVVDKFNQVRGIITRKDLCRFRIAPTGQVAERLFSRIY